MKKSLLALALTLALAGCVDTTGISADSSRPPAGNPNGAVVVAEYADLQCPACKAANTTIYKPLIAKYGTVIRYEYHPFPLRNIHRYALDLAEAAECAADQGKFWEYADLAFSKQDTLTNGSAEAFAAELKLDTDLFHRCFASHIKRKTVLQSYDDGVKLGVQGTPTFFVNGKQTEATLETLSAAIDAAAQGGAKRL